MKVCSKCKVEKPYSDFYNSAKSKDGRGNRCKSCDKIVRSTSRSRSPATQLGYRRRTLLRNYELTLEDYELMLSMQNYACAICGTTNPVGEGNATKYNSFSFAVDHNHATNEVRGLLCNPCNRGLGFFKDSQDLLKSALLYLQKYS